MGMKAVKLLKNLLSYRVEDERETPATSKAGVGVALDK